MENRHSRTEMLLGKDGVRRLLDSCVAVVGIGGVGGYAAEALVRAGVGELLFVDSDTVSVSNINRQIIATEKTVGMYKTEAMRERALEINPDVKVDTKNLFFSEKSAAELDLTGVDYIIDAIDSVSSKVALIALANEKKIPIISAMGAGNKLDAAAFEVADISKTSVCPLARAVRLGLRRRGINHLKVVYSKEAPKGAEGERLPGSVSFVPSVMGLIIAGEVIKDIALIERSKNV